MFWTSIEWGGTILGLLGAYILADKRYNPMKAWMAWLLSDILFVLLFTVHTGQYGLMLMHLFGGTICLLGMLQWSNAGKKVNPIRQAVIYNSSLMFLGFAGIALLMMFSPSVTTLKGFEWIGSFLSIAGGLLMASKHRFSPLSWIIWTVANFLILVLTIFTQQWGVAFLQLGFTILNVYGCYTWLYQKKFFGKLRQIKERGLRLSQA